MTDVRVRYTIDSVTLDDLPDVGIPQEAMDIIAKKMSARMEAMIFGSLSQPPEPAPPRPRSIPGFIRYVVS